jgi:hypothetical protein
MNAINMTACIFSLVLIAPIAHARTIELSDIDADLIACIRPECPRMSFAGYEIAPGVFTSDYIGLRPKVSMLIRVPLDKIPAGMRITKAEWIIHVAYQSHDTARMHAWRMTTEWGIGACYQYRMTRPKPIPWAVEGARGSATDRAEDPTAIAETRSAKDVNLNVTQDVELWYSGAAPNYGWMFTNEDDIDFRLNPPASTTRGTWKLRITYEPL